MGFTIILECDKCEVHETCPLVQLEDIPEEIINNQFYRCYKGYHLYCQECYGHKGPHMMKPDECEKCVYHGYVLKVPKINHSYGSDE